MDGMRFSAALSALLSAASSSCLPYGRCATGSVRFLHSYHYVNVPAADRPALALESGRWLAATGACVVLLGFSLLLPSPVADAFAIALVIALFAAIIMTCRVVVRRNGSLFG